jgi:hypothetical protein
MIPSALTNRTVRLALAAAASSNSRPIWNIRRTSPIWASPPNTGALLGTKMYANASGERAPSRLGPSMIPASISPTTSAWPKQRLPIHATSRATTMMTTSWSRMLCTPASDMLAAPVGEATVQH